MADTAANTLGDPTVMVLERTDEIRREPETESIAKTSDSDDLSGGPTTGMIFLFVLSFIVNLLFLTGPVFMMQVYDRVLPSGNISTLIGLFAIALLMYVAFGIFDALRQQISALRGEEIAAKYDGPAFAAAIDASAAGAIDARTTAPEDVETVRNFLTSPGIIALFDLPAMPFYFIAIFLLHPILGGVVVVAGIVLTILALINERQNRKRMTEAQQTLSQGSRLLNAARRDAQSLKANGMVGTAQDFWQSRQQEGRKGILGSLRIIGAFSSLTKTIRLAIQSLVLGIGGWLAVIGVMTPGAMIAASIVFSRAIAPLEQSLNNFRNLARARDTWKRIKTWAPHYADGTNAAFDLPAPKEAFNVSKVRINAPSTDTPLVQDVTTILNAGDVLAIIGPSGAGKSCVARALSGAWPISGGSIRLDGAELSQWPASSLGLHIGYLAQHVELMDGLVSENIARFRPDATEADIIAAAQAAGVHQLILSLPNGYQTKIGDGAVQLSGGQKQRIGLARALFGDPFLVVLDEPSAHLDGPGEQALVESIAKRNKNGKITIITSHDQKLLGIATKVMVLENGRMNMSGPRDKVLAKLKEQYAPKAGVPTEKAS